jgi:23S rRNA pseudouridine1911/1915/1917 synthase
VHRLDKGTSGVLILAKDGTTMKKLQKQFKRREVKKTYLALVSGRMRQRSGTMDAPIKRSHRDRRKFIAVPDRESEKVREAITDYFVIREFPGFSFVRLSPHSGRTHQLRVHLTAQGCPVLGDTLYGRRENFERLALHAYSIEFRHPLTGNLITADSLLPRIFRDFLKKAIAQP